MDDAAPVDPPARTGSASRFQHLRFHARGGCGEVEVALDRELGREVAYKRIQEPFADNAETRRRFEFEAEVTGQLEHPSIVPVYSAGLDAAGNPYYAMRLIRGESLEAVIQRHHAEGAGVLEERRLLGHLLAACQALAYAHSRGVVHRDIKPDNIMVGRFGETFVVDWGLAKRREGSDTGSEAGELLPDEDLQGSPVLTQPGSVAGTPAYMSPEQASGNLDSLDPRSDIYSLGSTLYKLLTGVDAFGQSRVTELLAAIRKGEFAPPRQRRAAIPAALDAICTKAMALDPQDRYASAEAFAQDIERWLADEPVEAWQEPVSVRVRRWVARHRTLVGTSVAALVVAAIGLGAVATVQARARKDLFDLNGELRSSNEQLVVAQTELEGANADLSRTNEELVRTNVELAEARERADARAELATRAVAGFTTAVEENDELQNLPELAELRGRLLEAPREFYQAFRDQLLAGGSVEASTQRQLADVYARLAKLSNLIGSQATAFEQLDEAQAAAEAALAQDPEDPDSRLLLAGIHEQRGGLYSGYAVADARNSYEESRRMHEQLLEERPDMPGLWWRLGLTYHNLGRLELRSSAFATALANLDHSLAALRQALEESPGNTDVRNYLVRTHELVAAAHSGLGDHGRAAAAYAEALDEARALVRQEPENRDFRFTLALLDVGSHNNSLRTGNADAAMEHGLEAVELLRGLCAERPSDSAYRSNLGHVLRYVAQLRLRRGEVAEARAELDESLAIVNGLLEREPDNLMYRTHQIGALQTLGGLHYAAGELAAAAQVFRDIVAANEALARLDPSIAQRRSLGGALYNVGILESVQGRIDEALAAYDRAIELRRALVQEDGDYAPLKTDLAYTLGNVAEILASRREDERALALQTEARDLQTELVRADPEGVRGRADLARTLAYLASLQQATGRLDEAEDGLVQAIATLEDVVEEEPSVTLYQRDLANAFEERGLLLGLRGHFAEAEEAFGLALEVLEELCRAHGAEAANHEQHGRALANLAELLVQYGEDELALDVTDQALSVLDPLLAANPENQAVRLSVQNATRARARAQARGGDVDAALASCRRAAGLFAEQGDRSSELVTATVAAWSGDASGVLDEVERLFTQERTPAERFELALLLAQAVPLTPVGELSARMTERALDQLELLAAADQLGPRQRVQLEHASDFAPLRGEARLAEILTR